MKSDNNILIAFLLNLSFSIFEFFGGIVCGSVAIASDAVHDFGDAASIGISYFLEKRSKKQPDEKHTFGYARYSVLGGFITSCILLIGSIIMILNAINIIITPVKLNYNETIVFALIGVCVNFCAAVFTHKGNSLNQKAVNLHMLEDVLGWVIVLIGSIVMRFTEFTLLDPLMSIGVSFFILVSAIRNLKEIVDLFLEKTPHGINITQIKEQIKQIDGVIDVYHIHLWSIDEHNNLVTMHVVTDCDTCEIKYKIRKKLQEYSIGHATIETETSRDCTEKNCYFEIAAESSHKHTHHCH